ncbi:hypothetical protein ACG3SL_19685 [Sphingomonas sp. CJ20]
MRVDHVAATAHFAGLDEHPVITEDSATWVGAIENCDVCSRPMQGETYMIDGKARPFADSMWANLCVSCAYKSSPNIGWGIGQLYRRQDDQWYLVAGGPPPEDIYDNFGD